MITVNSQITTRAAVDPLREGHYLPVSTKRTVLGSIGRIDGDVPATGACSLVRQVVIKLPPGRIHDGFGQTVVVDHAVSPDIFDGDGSKAIDDITTKLVSEVRTTVGDPFVDVRDNFLCLHSLCCAFLYLRELALSFSQRLLVGAKEAGIIHLLPIRKGDERTKSDINTHRITECRQRGFGNFRAKGSVPLPCAMASNVAGLYFSSDRTMKDGFNFSDLGKSNRTFANLKSQLWIGKAVIPTLPLKTGIAWLFASFRSSKEGFKSQVNSNRHILEYLGIDRIQRQPSRLKRGECYCLSMVIKRPFVLLPCVLSLFQEMVVEPAAFIERDFKQVFLVGGGVDTILKSLKHWTHYSLSIGLSQRRYGGFHLPAKAGSLPAAT